MSILPEKPILKDSREATTAITTLNRFVKVVSNKVLLCTAGLKSLGVVMSEGVAGEMVDVMVAGQALVEVGSGGVTEGQAVTSDGTGKAVLVAAVSVTITTGTVAVLGNNANGTPVVAGGKLPVYTNGYAIETVAENGFALIQLA